MDLFQISHAGPDRGAIAELRALEAVGLVVRPDFRTGALLVENSASILDAVRAGAAQPK